MQLIHELKSVQSGCEEECWECPAEASRRQTIKWNNFKVTVLKLRNEIWKLGSRQTVICFKLYIMEARWLSVT